MTAVYAYLRVSTDQQDVDNQRLGVVAYCAAKGLHAPIFVEDTASGKTDWKQRSIGNIIDQANAGDVIVASEVSRLARSLLQVLEIMRDCVTKQIHLHVVKNGFVLDGTMQAKVMATMFALAAEIERDFISSRTKEALQKKKAAGAHLGRPEGPAKSLRLDAHAAKIDEYLAKKIDKRTVAKLLDVSPNTLYNWLKSRSPEKINARGPKTPVEPPKQAALPSPSAPAKTRLKKAAAPEAVAQ
jgi:DNA invertase Pin-like site-specific DNA recombinase